MYKRQVLGVFVSGEQWTSDNPVLAVTDARTFQAEVGILSVKLADPTKEWYEKLRKSPAQGLYLTIYWTVPDVSTGTVLFDPYQGFPGRISSIAATRTAEGQTETDISSNDKMYYTARGVGEYTSDSWQRSIILPDGSINSLDSSHIIATRARQFDLLRY